MNFMNHLYNICNNISTLLPQPGILLIPNINPPLPTRDMNDFYLQCFSPPIYKYLNRYPQSRFLILPSESLINESSPLLMFRGDAQPPPLIFSRGFQPRILSAYRYRRPVYRPYMGDLNAGSAVSVTRDVQVAALFPVNLCGPIIEKSYIYLLAIDRYYDVHMIQVDRAFRNWTSSVPAELGGRRLSSLWDVLLANQYSKGMIFAHELATMDVPYTHVLGCLCITRKQNEEIKFVVQDVLWNKNAKIELNETVKIQFEQMRGTEQTAPSQYGYDLKSHGYEATSEPPQW